DTGANILTFEGEKFKISGFFWEGNTEQLLRGSSALIDEPIAAGRVILFNFEPGFRMIWTSTIQLLLDAIVYGPSQPQNTDERYGQLAVVGGREKAIAICLSR